jgi:uncharacterized protein
MSSSRACDDLGMRVTITESASELAERAGALLAARPEHNVLATVLEIAERGTPGGGAVFAFAEGSEGDVIAAAMRLPPRRMIASMMDEATAAALLEEWLRADPDVPGVGGPSRVVRAMASEWERRVGGRSELVMAQALHALEQVIDPARPAPGRIRLAVEADRELLIDWTRAFLEGEGLSDDPTGMVASRQMYLWEDQEPVSLLGVNAPVGGAVRIGPVYTPLEYRGRGYATSAVAAASRLSLEQGARRCLLFTDLANPTSNRIYASVGYRRIADWEEMAFSA